MPTHSSALAQSSDQPELPKSFDELIADLNTKGVMRQIDAQLVLGDRIGKMIIGDRAAASELLSSFRAKAPTRVERLNAKKPIVVSEESEPKRHDTPYDHLHVVTGDVEPSGPEPVAIVNDHVRLSVLMRVMKIVMMNDGKHFQDYVRFRDSFIQQMNDEMQASDKKLKESQTAARKRPTVTSPASENNSDPKVVNAVSDDALDPPIGGPRAHFLTFADYVMRLEDQVIQAASASESREIEG
jgi:hypothetical protein